MADYIPKGINSDKELRKVRLKLECPSEVEWERWKPGREHQKTFYVKNILNKVQTLRWEEPDSPYFKTNFQEPHARLNPGMTAAIVIYFLPKSTEEYHSAIPFRTARGSFTLHLRGLLPSVSLGLPVRIDYKYCPVKDITTKTFDIYNDQDFIVGYKWMSVTRPFSVTPVEGYLKPRQSATMSCHFCPDNATAYEGTACIGTTTKATGQVKLFGVGKYTFITLHWQVVPFGDVLNRTSKEMEQILTNISPVTAYFSIQRVEAWYYGHAPVFTIIPMNGAIPPNSFLSLKVLYHPVVAGTFSYEQFEVVTSQDRRALFACSGTAARPVIKLTVPFMDFGSVEIGCFSHRTITLENHSAAPVHFYFATDEIRYFEWPLSRAVCNANRSILLHCNFRPMETANYYKRVMIILQDQYPLFVDLMGTGYKVALRAATILPYHVYEHRENLKLIIAEREVAHVLKKDVPELAAFRDDDDKEIAAMYFDVTDIFYGVPTDDPKNEPPEWSWLETPTGQHVKFRSTGMRSGDTSSYALANMLLDSEPEESQVFSRPHDWDLQVTDEIKDLMMHHRQEATGRLSAFECWEEYFMGRMVDWDPVSVDKTYVDFGLGNLNVETPALTVHVRNNLADSVTVMWVQPLECEHPHVASHRARYVASKLPPKPNSSAPKPLTAVFCISPEKIRIPARSSMPFSFTFKPPQVNMFYVQSLTCFAWTQTSYHVVPCWSSVLQLSGNSFQDRSHIFLPRASLSTHSVVFPPAAKGTSVYQNIMIYNHDANTPLRYHWVSEELPAEFRLKPAHGLIPPKDFNIVSFRFDAGEPKTSLGRVTVYLNDSPTITMQVNLTATSHIAKVRLESYDQAVCFKPTSIGTQAILNTVIINSSAIPANFEWQIPDKYEKIFVIEPQYGFLQAGERRCIEFSFFPKKTKLYYCKAHCVYGAVLEKAFVQDNTLLIEGVTSNELEEFLMVVNGAGISQTISITPEKLDFGTVVTGFPYKLALTLFNPSFGDLRFLLEYSHGPRVKHDSFHLVLDCKRGVLPGGLTKTIFVTVHPTKAQIYDFKVICKTFLPPILLNVDGCTYQKMKEICQNETRYDESDEAVESMASCTLGMNAIHPTVQVVSARSYGLSTPQFFRSKLVKKWNRDLREGEILLRPNGRVVYQELFCLGAPIKDSPEDYVLDFGFRQLGTRTSYIWLAIKSGTVLPVSWWFRLWNDTDVDVENWVTEAPASDYENDLLIWRSYFEIEPRKDHLEAGKTAFVRFSYRADVEGRHDFPAILQITDGRSVHFFLRGTTVAQKPKVLLHQPDRHFLKSMVVGDLNSPVQTTELINNCAMDMKYELDIAPLVHMQEMNNGFRVLWCLNPSGIIPPMQSVLVQWVFQPLQPKTYSVEIPVRVRDSGQGGMLKIEGRGRNPCEPYDPLSTDDNPPQMPGTSYEWPGVPAGLSSDILDFGVVEELSVTIKLVAVHNRLPKTPIAYWWKKSVAADQHLDGEFMIVPERGVLDPGKRTLCKVEFLAGVKPQLFETTLHLEISVMLDADSSLTNGSLTPTEASSEIIVDTWPKELGVFTWNENFQHHSALMLSTISSRSKVTDFALQRLAANPYLHFFERMDEEVLHTPPASNFMLYLTVVGHIKVKHFLPTTDDLLTADQDKVAGAPQERLEIEVRAEFVSGIMLELLQESLHDEKRDDTFRNLDTGRQLCFEEFQQECPRPVSKDEAFAALFMSLGDGELPPKPLCSSLDHTPDEPRPSLHVRGSKKTKMSGALDEQMPWMSELIRAIESDKGEEGDEPESPTHSSMAALAETIEVVLEDALFCITAEFFEGD